MKKNLERFYLFLTFLFLYAPISVLIIYSFNESRLRGKFTGFSLKWYIELFKNEEILKSMQNTIAVAIIATFAATVIGIIAAIGIHFSNSGRKKLILNLNYIPVINPDIVTAVSMMALFKFLNINLGMVTMIISHIVFSTPYVVLSILPKLKQMDKNILDAALDLGANYSYAIIHVIIPEIKAGIFSGALIAFTLSIDDFAISYFNTGHGFSNLSIMIYSMTKKGINPSINALSTLMFLGLFLLLLVINKRTKEENIE